MLDADKLKKLEQRQVELADVFIEETDTTKWPTPDTRDGRGDRYWIKRNAGSTATLIVKIQSILDAALRQPPISDPKDPVPGDEPEEAEENTEQLAATAIAEAGRIIERARGTRFEKKPKK
jgi:hypothetical protein